MTNPTYVPLTLGILLAGAIIAGAAHAQSDRSDKPIDFKQFIPPVLPLPPLPPDSQVNSGVVGGSQMPYTTAPLYDATPSPNQPAPGLKLTFPSR
jgi:hypothetical protein